MKVLIIEDDPILNENIRGALNAENIRTEFVFDGQLAERMLRQNKYDCIVLDINLPGKNGYEICKDFRTFNLSTPVIILTAFDELEDKIHGYDCGADDYVTKPFKIGVLMARLRAHIRQHEQSEYVVLRLGPYTFRPGAKLLMDNETNRKVRLTDKEAAIIKFLHLCNGRVVSRDVLLGEIWGYNADLTTHTLETHVYRLRQKIERDPSKAKLLVTEHNGYRLVV